MAVASESSTANFAYNLARLCKREASIAAVCRATRINRQQFNRYLAGRAVPNVANRAKICQYFKVSEQELFRAPAAARSLGGPDMAGPNPQGPPWSHGEVGSVLRLLYSGSRPSIAPGIYVAHFSELQQRASVIQSTIIVRNDGALTMFRRVTGLAERQGSWWGQFWGDHRGVVLERAHWMYFLGLNASGVLEPSMMVLRWLPGARPMLGGFASVNTTRGPAPIAAVVTASELPLRGALRAAHAYSADDPALDPMVLEALEEQASILASKTARSGPPMGWSDRGPLAV